MQEVLFGSADDFLLHPTLLIVGRQLHPMLLHDPSLLEGSA
jgi:hypothetical protein